MTTDLGERLDNMAAVATAGLQLRHPAEPETAPVVTDRQPRRFALVAASALFALLVSGWFLSQRESDSVVDLADRPLSQPVPSLLREEPTPLSDLPAHLRDVFQDTRLPPLDALGAMEVPPEFVGVHVVERDDVTVVVGLDTTGRVLCVAESIGDLAVTGSGCGTPAGFAVGQESSSSLSNLGGDLTVYFVAEGVVTIETESGDIDVERNVAIADRLVDGPVVLRRSDGSVNPGAQFPDPDVAGELLLPGQGSMSLAQVGCSLVGENALVELAFVGTDGFVSAVVVPEGVYLTGSTGEDALVVTAPGAVVETEFVDGMMQVAASWADEAGSWGLTADCGEYLLDLSDIR